MMQDTKKAVPVVTHQDGRMETGPASQAGPHLHDNNTTSPPEGQGFRVADFLHPGQENAIPLRDLVNITGLRERDLRRQIEKERRNGIPILSNSKDGYWMGENHDEIAQFVQDMKRRAKQIRLTAEAVGEAAGIGK